MKPPTKSLVICDGDLPSLVALAREAERLLQSPTRSLDDSMTDHMVEADATSVEAGSGGGINTEAKRLFVWPACHQADHSPIVYRAIEQQAGYYDATLLEHQQIGDSPIPQTKLARAWSVEFQQVYLETQMLISVAYTARSMGVERIVWPKHIHSDTATITGQLEQIACAVDRALLISRLVHLDYTIPPASAADRTRADAQDIGRANQIEITTPFVDLTSEQLAELAVDMHAPIYLTWWMHNVSKAGSHNRAGMIEHKTQSAAQKLKQHWLSWLNRVGWADASAAAISAIQE